MHGLLHDLRYAVRLLIKSPGFTVVAVLILALGIGANTAIFSAIDAVLLRPLPYPDADRLQIIFAVYNGGFLNTRTGPVDDRTFVEWQKQNHSFEALAEFQADSANLTGGAEPERVDGSQVSADLFPILRVRPALGRGFRADEDQRGHTHVVILSDQLWRRRFGSNPGVIGRSVGLSGELYTIVGVMPPAFAFPDRADYWVPAEIVVDETHNVFLKWAIGRLRPGITREQAQADLSVISARVNRTGPVRETGPLRELVNVVGLQQQAAAYIRPALLIVFAAVGLVLLAACSNIANLLLARSTVRRREVAIRTAVGAGRGRLFRQFLAEGLLLALVGGCFGIILALWSMDILRVIFPINDQPFMPALPVSHLFTIDRSVLAFTALLSLLTGIAFAAVPALYARKVDIQESLKETSAGSGGWTRLGLRSFLTIGEISIALVLLISAALLLKSFAHMLAIDPGTHSRQALTFDVWLPETAYHDIAQFQSFYSRAIERLNAVPGVDSAGVISALPLNPGGAHLFGTLAVEGKQVNGMVSKVVVSSNVFRAAGIPLLNGRYFNDADTARSLPVAMVTSSFARQFWPGEDPIGKRVSLTEPKPKWLTVVGVIADVRQDSLFKPVLAVYFPYSQAAGEPALLNAMSFVVRPASADLDLWPAVRHAIAAVDSNLPIFHLATIGQLRSAVLAQPRLILLLVGNFALLALLLTLMGLWSVMSWAVTARTHEIGVRISLGARAPDVLRLILQHAIYLIAAGVSLGLFAAFASTRALASLLYGVTATDGFVFASVTVLVVGLVLLASYLPARRATQVDPVIALRYE